MAMLVKNTLGIYLIGATSNKKFMSLSLSQIPVAILAGVGFALADGSGGCNLPA